MKLTAQIKLLPTPEQADALKHTLETANAAANYVSEHAWQTKTFRQLDLHRALYYKVRSRFSLSAQVTVRIFAKVGDAYKLDCECKRVFKPFGSIAYDPRILSWQLLARTVSIWTSSGRQKMPFTCGEHQMKLLQGLRGECDLVLRKGVFFLFQSCDIEDTPEIIPDEFLGIDLGINNIAADSDGTLYQGKAVKGVRYRHRKLRHKLQAKGTKSAKRRLKHLSGKESRFARHVNHEISKQVVSTAQATGRGIALEELKGIRRRVTTRRSQRATLHSWAFHQLRGFIQYKAKRAGIPVVAVDPRHTSQTCPACGLIDKRNRPTQALFSCVSCGYSGVADTIAAVIISGRADVTQPYAAIPG